MLCVFGKRLPYSITDYSHLVSGYARCYESNPSNEAADDLAKATANPFAGVPSRMVSFATAKALITRIISDPPPNKPPADMVYEYLYLQTPFFYVKETRHCSRRALFKRTGRWPYLNTVHDIS